MVMLRLTTLAFLASISGCGDNNQYICGKFFMLENISDSQSLVLKNDMEDFSTYQYNENSGSLKIYEGYQPNISPYSINEVLSSKDKMKMSGVKNKFYKSIYELKKSNSVLLVSYARSQKTFLHLYDINSQNKSAFVKSFISKIHKISESSCTIRQNSDT